MPQLFIITGSNGAGKSSVGPDYLPVNIKNSCEVFDGDKLFMTKQVELWKQGIRAHKEAKKLAFSFVSERFESLVDDAIETKSDFVYEGHFTNESTWDIPKRFKESGFQIHLIFFGLIGTDLSEMRVVDRTKEGGHYVDPITISDNYYGNLEKLDKYHTLFDSIQIVDTSETDHEVLCILENNSVQSSVSLESLPNWFRNNLPGITEKIAESKSH